MPRKRCVGPCDPTPKKRSKPMPTLRSHGRKLRCRASTFLAPTTVRQRPGQPCRPTARAFLHEPGEKGNYRSERIGDIVRQAVVAERRTISPLAWIPPGAVARGSRIARQTVDAKGAERRNPQPCLRVANILPRAGEIFL